MNQIALVLIYFGIMRRRIEGGRKRDE